MVSFCEKQLVTQTAVKLPCTALWQLPFPDRKPGGQQFTVGLGGSVMVFTKPIRTTHKAVGPLNSRRSDRDHVYCGPQTAKLVIRSLLCFASKPKSFCKWALTRRNVFISLKKSTHCIYAAVHYTQSMNGILLCLSQHRIGICSGRIGFQNQFYARQCA